MTSGKKHNEPGFFETLESDLNTTRLSKDFRRDIKDIIEFYVSPQKQEMLRKMNPVKRGFFYFVWILKSMILKLTPLRRLLLLLGFLFVITSFKVEMGDLNFSFSSNLSILGDLLIIIVLMLELKDKLLAKDELVAGRKIQEALMPEESPYLDGWSVWLFSKPANEVSGDIVDFFHADENRTVIYMSDVAGKGLNAALMTSKLQAIIRALAPDHITGKLISRVNSSFYKEKLRKMFASLFYIEINKNSSTLEIVNAGHLPAFIIKNNKIIEMNKGDAALGLMKNYEYSVTQTEFEKGDVLLVYSDGVTEAKNKQGDFYGLDNLRSFLIKNTGMPVNKLGTSLISEIELFATNAHQNDDISLIILKKM